MKILFLGGTGFLGPPFIRMALEHGHEITLFNRGRRDELFPDLELIKGNRIVDVDPGLQPLADAMKAGRRWDVVIDTASVHTWTENTAALLKDAAERYTYISSLSVYERTDAEEQVEGDPVATMPDDIADGIDRLPYDMTYYGAVKARSEAAAEEHFPGKATVIRPGLIVGPGDTTHRFSYWPLRIRQGGEVMAPGNPTDPVMFIDVREVAALMLSCLEGKHFGIYNANGPVSRDMTIGKLVEGCRAAIGAEATFTWVDADFLRERGIGGWVQMPVWIPPVGQYKGFHQTSLARAKRAGLTTRPLDETVRDTLKWFDEWQPKITAKHGWTWKPGERNTPGVSREQEAEVLAEWHAREG